MNTADNIKGWSWDGQIAEDKEEMTKEAILMIPIKVLSNGKHCSRNCQFYKGYPHYCKLFDEKIWTNPNYVPRVKKCLEAQVKGVIL
jgi:hypothetical protein